jgi:hypothetical protein
MPAVDCGNPLHIAPEGTVGVESRLKTNGWTPKNMTGL